MSGKTKEKKSKMGKKRSNSTKKTVEINDEPPKKRARQSKKSKKQQDQVEIPPLPQESDNVTIPPLPNSSKTPRRGSTRSKIPRAKTSVVDPIIPQNKSSKSKNKNKNKTKTKSKSKSKNKQKYDDTEDDDDKDFSDDDNDDSDVDIDEFSASSESDSVFQPLSQRVKTKTKSKTKTKNVSNSQSKSKSKTKSKTTSKTKSKTNSSRKDKAKKTTLKKSKTASNVDLNILMISSDDSDDSDDSDEETSNSKKSKTKTKTKTKSKSKGKEKETGKGKGKKKVVEKRRARFRNVCSQKTRDRIDRAMWQRMFMVSAEIINEHKRKYAVLGSTGNVYFVTIGDLNECTCPDFLKGNLCKHVLFVMLKVLRVQRHSELVYQKALLSSELETIFNNAPQTLFGVLANDQVRTKYAQMTGNAVDNSNSNDNKIERKEIEGDCAICMEEMIEGKNDRKNALVWCQGQCGQNIHKQCFNEWAKNQISSGDEVTCPYCRTRWANSEDYGGNSGSNGRGGRGRTSGGDYGDSVNEGYLNFGEEQGQDRYRDTSTYSDWGWGGYGRRRRWGWY